MASERLKMFQALDELWSGGRFQPRCDAEGNIRAGVLRTETEVYVLRFNKERIRQGKYNYRRPILCGYHNPEGDTEEGFGVVPIPTSPLNIKALKTKEVSQLYPSSNLFKELVKGSSPTER